MNIYKRKLGKLIMNIFWYTIGIAAIAFVIYMFLPEKPIFFIGIPALIYVFSLYSLFFGDAIKIELDEKEIRYYKRNKLKKTYNIKDCKFGYQTKTTGSGDADSINLQIINVNTGEEEMLDLEPLGDKQFFSLFDKLKEQTKESPRKLEKKAEEPKKKKLKVRKEEK